jgi:hypothetical protein
VTIPEVLELEAAMLSITHDAIKRTVMDYAGRGWPVFPLHTPMTFGPKTGADRAKCSCGDGSCQNQGKHPRTSNGLRDATTDLELIERWWDRWPDANIGVRTGDMFDVLDLDGTDALDALDDAAPGAPALVGPMVHTGRGLHIYMTASGTGNRNPLLAGGVDWRGRGGYVVAPPSLHHLGHRYQWDDVHGIDAPLTALPRWLDDLVHKRTPARPPAPSGRPLVASGRYGARALDAEVAKVATSPEGTRNGTLNAAAFSLGQLVAGGELDAGTVAQQLLVVAMRSGLPEAEALATIRSGMTSGARTPRTAPTLGVV